MFSCLLLTICSLPFTISVAVPYHPTHDHSNIRLPDTWYQPEHHPAYKLFRRDSDGTPTDGYNYPSVGSPTWYSAYPTSTPDPSQYPQAWVDALDAAVAAGTIPDIPQSSQSAPATNPFYPSGYNPSGPEVCSGTYKCRIPGDFWDAPNGYFGTGFDDGPLPTSTALYDFLGENNETATHFMIGVNILNNPTVFSQAFSLGHDIGLHTWTHPYMTLLNNSELLGQFGWSMEMIHNSTGGRLPRFWRPPYGDTDTRVQAIAKQVFGLDTIVWNQDTEDWSLGEAGGTTPAAINTSLTTWLTGPKTPGLIILEHELTNASGQAFIDAYPLIKSNGWNMVSVTQLIGNGTAYQNSANSLSPVTPAGILPGGNSTLLTSSTSTSASTALPTQSATKSGVTGSTQKNGAGSIWTAIPFSSPWCHLLATLALTAVQI